MIIIMHLFEITRLLDLPTKKDKQGMPKFATHFVVDNHIGPAVDCVHSEINNSHDGEDSKVSAINGESRNDDHREQQEARWDV